MDDAFLEEADEFEEEGFEEFDEFGEEMAFDEAEEALEDVMAYALDAEDTDEFFGRLFKGIKKIARKAWRGVRRVGRVVGKVARVAAPIASLIPHPYAQIASKGLGLLSKLRAEGATEDEALEAFAELAAYDEAVTPIVAGLAARSLLRRKAARLPFTARKRVVKGINTAAKILVARRGPKAIRALPRIVSSLRRTAAVKRTPVRAIPKIVKRTAAKVARNRPLVKKLSRPVPSAVLRVRTVARRSGSVVSGAPKSFVVQGPVRISLTPVV